MLVKDIALFLIYGNGCELMMNEEYELVFPTKEYRDAWLTYIEELIKFDKKIIPSNLAANNYDTFLSNVILCEKGAIDSKKYVPSKLLFFVNKKQPMNILGIIDIRMEINDIIRDRVGNIGLSIRPSYRKNGYGEIMLKYGLDFLSQIGFSEIIYICSEDNFKSRKLVEKFNVNKTEKFNDGVEGRYRYYVSTK